LKAKLCLLYLIPGLGLLLLLLLLLGMKHLGLTGHGGFSYSWTQVIPIPFHRQHEWVKEAYSGATAPHEN
jgi:hypothetical protein